MNSLIIVSAYVLDLLLGDPRWFPHPVRMIGWFIQKTEAVLRWFSKTPLSEKIAGGLLVILIVSLTYAASSFIIQTSFRSSWYLGIIISALLAYTTLAARSLADAAGKVHEHLTTGDINAARKELSLIVGRDTENLDEEELSRAVVETVAENASDGVIAPLFYLALGGPALALAYKAVNTLDSMLGYKNDRYLHFGWAAARLDDVANFLPARITAVLICLAAEIVRWLAPKTSHEGKGDTEFLPQNSALPGTWRIMLRDGRSHPSPNSGYPEAAMAGALGIRLGGQSSYGGTVSCKPYIGDRTRPIDKKHIEKSVLFMYCTTSFAALGAAGILFLF